MSITMAPFAQNITSTNMYTSRPSKSLWMEMAQYQVYGWNLMFLAICMLLLFCTLCCVLANLYSRQRHRRIYKRIKQNEDRHFMNMYEDHTPNKDILTHTNLYNSIDNIATPKNYSPRTEQRKVSVQYTNNTQNNDDIQMIQSTEINEINDTKVNCNSCEMNCDNIRNCKDLIFLVKVMNQYDHKPADVDCDEAQNIRILNAFHHLLIHHNQNDLDFHFIFDAFGGECLLSECAVVQRHYSTDIQSLYDQIHCHFQHSYHVFRLSRDEQQQLHNDTTQLDLNRILKEKRDAFITTVKSSRMTAETNKFTDSIQLVKTAANTYSYSFNFTYFTLEDEKKFVGEEKISDMRYGLHSDGLFGWQSRVYPSYKSLKEELLTNDVKTISKICWNDTEKNAQLYLKTTYCRSMVANTNNNNDYRRFYFHPAHFGYKDGESRIAAEHIQCIMIYCAQDAFQREYRKSYRAQPDDEEGWKDIKKRHATFYHFARTLREAIEVFGTLYREGDIESVYHGIDRNVIFDGMQAHIYSPLSTTQSEHVALQFAGSSGLVLELKPNATLKYFICECFSPYPMEQEVLFVGGLDRINFVNIKNIKNIITGCSYRDYINSLRMIDTMTYGVYFSENIFQTITGTHFPINEKEIKHRQELTKALVEHQLKYSKLENLDPYIGDLLHGICSRKHKVWYDLETMNENLLAEIEILPDGNVGYLGYKCLYPYLCNDFGIDLNKNLALFPSVQTIYIGGLQRINAHYIDHIFKFLSQKESLQQIKLINLRIKPKWGKSNIEEIINQKKSEFFRIKYELSHSFNGNSKEHGLMFERLPNAHLENAHHLIITL